MLRNRLSYLADDLVIPTWNGAFIYDTEAGAAATLELFEFANSQLLEFRYYDHLLDTELGRIYATLQRSTLVEHLFGPRRISARRTSCTRCSSTSTSSPIGPRTR